MLFSQTEETNSFASVELAQKTKKCEINLLKVIIFTYNSFRYSVSVFFAVSGCVICILVSIF